MKFMNIDKELCINVISQRDLDFLNENVEVSDVECAITNALFCIHVCKIVFAGIR